MTLASLRDRRAQVAKSKLESADAAANSMRKKSTRTKVAAGDPGTYIYYA